MLPQWVRRLYMRTTNVTEEYKFFPIKNWAYTDSLFKIYVGSLTHLDIKEKVEDAALIIFIGGLGTCFALSFFFPLSDGYYLGTIHLICYLLAFHLAFINCMYDQLWQ
jgi:hypothetical protein